MFHALARSSYSWRYIFILKLLYGLSNALLIAEQLDQRTTVPAPIVVPASQDWDGSDGPWSSFALQIGTPPQIVKTFVSTASTQTWAVAPEGCISTDPKNCPDTRGRLYDYKLSSTWVPNLANASTQIYKLGLESGLGYTGVGRYGFDNITLAYKGMGGPMLQNQTLASISTTDFWIGIFGVNPRPSNFSDFNNPVPSFLSNLRSQSLIPSTSWAYTAGNQYRFNYVLGSLTLGGYDSSKFIPNDLTWELAPRDDRDLIVQIEDITTEGSGSLLPEAVPALLDSTVPYIYLPVAACEKIEKAFGLTLDNATGLYLVNDTQHSYLQGRNPNITFTIGNVTSTTKVNIVLPYAAFDLTVTYPHVTDATRYFPLKRAETVDQYTLGRTFFQEAYVIADFDRRNFSVSQCNWDGVSPQSIVAIIPPSNGTSQEANPTGTPSNPNTKSKPVSAGAIAGGAGGGVIVVACAIFFFWFRRKRKIKQAEEKAKAVAAIGPDPVLKPELDGYERIPKIYETAPEVDVLQDGRNFVPSVRLVEIGDTPIYEMPAGEVAAEMPGIGNGKSKSEKEKDNLSPRSPPGAHAPTTPTSPTERTTFLEKLHRGSVPASPVSRTATPPSMVRSSIVSPASTLHGERSGPRSPRSATSVVSSNSLMYSDRSPVDELFYDRSDRSDRP